MQGTWSQGQLVVSHELPAQLHADIITVIPDAKYSHPIVQCPHALYRLLPLLRMLPTLQISSSSTKPSCGALRCVLYEMSFNNVLLRV